MPGADDAHSNNLLSRKSKSGGFRLGYPTDAENKNSEVEAHSNDLASYSESNNESLRGDHNYNNYNLYGVERNTSIGKEAKTPINNHKPSKRKAEDSKNISVVQSERNTGQDSRIVRVNRASGGKDRHSKVRTSKGLRDRRVRLSVSTAIQFYDLQDRLGCEQPSKAVDWLINAAKSAIDALPVLETETPAAVCKLSQTLASSNCSPANVTVLAPAGVFAATMGASSESAQNNQKGEEAVTAAQILNQASAALRQSEVGRFSSSSTSDGSIKGGDISNSSLPKSTSRGKDRFKEARERAKKKSASAKNPSGPYPQELNQMRSSFAESLNNVVSSNTHLPAQDKSQYSTRDHRHNPYGLPNPVSSSSSNIQQLWDTVSSYTDILCQDAVDHHEHQQQLHHMGSLCSPSHAGMQQPTPTSSSVAAVGTTYLRRHNEMGGSGMQLFDAHNPNPKQRHNRLEGNVVHFQAINLYSDPMRSLLKNNIDVSQGLLQHQHESQTVQKEFASTFNVPAFSNDVNFSTSCLSSRGALQSNSCSGPPDTPPLPINQKNPYCDDSTQLHFEVLQGDTHNFQGFDAQIPERFQLAFNFGESTKQEHSYISDPRRR